jgi:hypothetical protein
MLRVRVDGGKTHRTGHFGMSTVEGCRPRPGGGQQRRPAGDRHSRINRFLWNTVEELVSSALRAPWIGCEQARRRYADWPGELKAPQSIVSIRVPLAKADMCPTGSRTFPSWIPSQPMQDAVCVAVLYLVTLVRFPGDGVRERSVQTGKTANAHSYYQFHGADNRKVDTIRYRRL